MHKIRIIQKGGGTITFGLSIPKKLNHWAGTHVNVVESGDKLILESGALPTAITTKDLNKQSKTIEIIQL